MNKVTLEKHLAVLDKKYNTKLSNFWAVAKYKYEKLLSNIKISFPFYSRHDASHAQTVISNIENVLGQEGIKKLDITDTWMILECAYIHDLGMLIGFDEIQSDWNSPMFATYVDSLLNQKQGDLYFAATTINNPEKILFNEHKSWSLEITRAVVLLISDFYRPKHATRSATKYIEEWVPQEQKDTIKQRITNLIAIIASFHTSNFDSIMSLAKEDNGQINDYIHPRFIAALLRLGDVLDIDNNRFDNYLLQQFESQLPEATEIHKGKHDAINKLLIKYDKIEIEADCATTEIYFETNSWINSIKNEVNNAAMYWDSIAMDEYKKFPRVESKLSINGKEILHGFENIKYDFSQAKVFEIIKGSNIYESDHIFIREFIQNAIDASKIKIWMDFKTGKIQTINKDDASNLQPCNFDTKILDSYQITVNIKACALDEKRTTIYFEIIDNGVGFSTQDILRLSQIGNSWRQDKNMNMLINEMPRWLRPTGSFGIGMQSAFLLTNKISINTINESGQYIELELRSSKGNENILVLEAKNSQTYRTRISVVFVTENEYLVINRPQNFRNYLHNINPCRDANIELLWENRLLCELTTCLSYSFIPININTTEKKVVYDLFNNEQKASYEPECIKLPVACYISKYEVLHDDENITAFANSTLNNIAIWDKHQSAFLQIMLPNRTMYGYSNGCRVNFKEIRVSYQYEKPIPVREISFRPSYFHLEVSLWGLDAKTSLMLNRTSFIPEAETALISLIRRDISILIKHIKKKIISASKIGCYPLSLYCLFLEYSPDLVTDDLVNALATQADNLEIEVYVLGKETNAYVQKKLQLSRMIKEYPNIFFLSMNFLQNFDDILEHIRIIGIPWFICSQPYASWFEGIKKEALFIYKQNYQTLKIYKYNKNACIEIKDFDDDNYQYSIKYNDTLHPELHVKKLPLIYSLSECEKDYAPSFLIYPRYSIIINKEKVCKQSNDTIATAREQWTAGILKEIEDDGIIDFVYLNQEKDNLFAPVDIREAYKRMIEDCWDRIYEEVDKNFTIDI